MPAKYGGRWWATRGDCPCINFALTPPLLVLLWLKYILHHPRPAAFCCSVAPTRLQLTSARYRSGRTPYPLARRAKKQPPRAERAKEQPSNAPGSGHGSARPTSGRHEGGMKRHVSGHNSGRGPGGFTLDKGPQLVFAWSSLRAMPPLAQSFWCVMRGRMCSPGPLCGGDGGHCLQRPDHGQS